jgi:excisionase family DNA binding protein
MPKLPSELQAAYSDLQEAFEAADERAGTSQGMPDFFRTSQVFRDAWESDPRRKAESDRRARLVEEHTGPDTPYGKAKAKAKEAARSLRVNIPGKPFLIPAQHSSAVVLASGVLATKDEEGHHLAESLRKECSDLHRLRKDADSTPQVKEALERWEKEGQAVESEARQLRVDGCWYLTHPDSLQDAVKLGEKLAAVESAKEGSVAVTKALLKTISQAAEALVGWFQETRVLSDDGDGTANPPGDAEDTRVTMTAARAARYIGVSSTTLRRWLVGDGGSISAESLGGNQYRFYLKQLVAHKEATAKRKAGRQ